MGAKYMRTNLLNYFALLLLLGMTGGASARLVTEGTVEYGGAQRNLIYDTDLNITWLDYSNVPTTISVGGGTTQVGGLWTEQMSWADNLSLTVNGITYSDWRLPSSYSDYQDGQDNLHSTDSEMGHLYFTELGLPGAELNSNGFHNLTADWYWSGTENAVRPSLAVAFGMFGGIQDPDFYKWGSNMNALAVHSGHIAAPIPEPETYAMLLTGLGLLGVMARRRKEAQY